MLSVFVKSQMEVSEMGFEQMSSVLQPMFGGIVQIPRHTHLRVLPAKCGNDISAVLGLL